MSPGIVKEFSRFDKGRYRFLKHTIASLNGRSVTVDVGYERFLALEEFFNPEIHSSDFLTPSQRRWRRHLIIVHRRSKRAV